MKHSLCVFKNRISLVFSETNHLENEKYSIRLRAAFNSSCRFMYKLSMFSICFSAITCVEGLKHDPLYSQS